VVKPLFNLNSKPFTLLYSCAQLFPQILQGQRKLLYVVIKAYKLTVFEILRNFFVLSYIACPCYPYTRVYDKDHAAHMCEFDAKVSFIHESACLLYKVQGSLLYHLKCTQRGMAVLVCAHGIIHPF